MELWLYLFGDQMASDAMRLWTSFGFVLYLYYHRKADSIKVIAMNPPCLWPYRWRLGFIGGI